MIHLVIIGMRLNKLIEEVHSSRIKFKLNNNLIDVLLRNDDTLIGYIKEIYDNNDIILEFDLNNNYHNIGLQTEILREYLRYKYLWEKYDGIIKCYPKNDKTINVLNKRYFILKNNFYFIDKNIYFSHVEKLSLFDDNLNRLPYPNLRGEKIKEGTYAGIVDIIIKNIKNNKYLTTRRDLNKVTSPGLWEITGGGIDYEEDIEHAVIRESFEETGLKLLKYIYLDSFKMDDLVYFSYLGFVSCNDCDVKLQKGETIDYKWLNKDELIKLYQTDNIPPKQKIRINKLMNKI